MVTIEFVSSRVAYLIFRIIKRYSLKIISTGLHTETSAQVYDLVEVFYEDISRAIHISKTKLTFYGELVLPKSPIGNGLG